MSSAEIKQIWKIRAAYALLLFTFYFDSKVVRKMELVSGKNYQKRTKP